MAPHLETIDVPAGVEDAAAIALDHPFVVDALAWGLRSMVDLLAEHQEGPGAIELGAPARMLRERLDDLYAGGEGPRLRGARRTPRQLLALTRYARRTVVPAFASMADLPPMAGDAAIDALRDEFGATVAPQGGATVAPNSSRSASMAASPAIGGRSAIEANAGTTVRRA